MPLSSNVHYSLLFWCALLHCDVLRVGPYSFSTYQHFKPTGKAGEMIDRGDNTYGGKYVINPSGGLISKGHPLGATGLAQCAELCWQLRGLADKRQVASAKVALQHNLGLGGAVVITLYRLGFPQYTNRYCGKFHRGGRGCEDRVTLKMYLFFMR